MYALFTKIYRQRKLFFQNRLSIENKTQRTSELTIIAMNGMR